MATIAYVSCLAKRWLWRRFLLGGLHLLLGRNCACKFAIMFGRVSLAWITDITRGLSEFWGITLPFTAHDVWCGSVVFSCVVFDLILAFINPSSPTLRKYTPNTPYLSCPSMTFLPHRMGNVWGAGLFMFQRQRVPVGSGTLAFALTAAAQHW